MMASHDDDLARFEAEGAAPLPVTAEHGYVEHEGARIWYASYGAGAPVILLHGGLGNSGNWGYQVPVLVERGYRAVLIDSRGHGRSTRDARPYSYELMASDVVAVMDALGVERAAMVGWSDGACTALILADRDRAALRGCCSLLAIWILVGLKRLNLLRYWTAVSADIGRTMRSSRLRRGSLRSLLTRSA